MSDNIPFEIQVNIIKWLPIRSVIQFRSVSKTWKSLIDSSRFIACYSGQQQHLLAWYYDLVDSQSKFVSLVDDDSFPLKQVSPTIPLLVRVLKIYNTVGSSHGLLCFYGDYQRGRDGPLSGKGRVVLWNPSIGKAVAVVVPNVAKGNYGTVLGFGVCRETTDPKIIKITFIRRGSISSIPWQVEIFTLSTGVWRRPYNNLPRKSIQFDCDQEGVALDGVFYWLATNRIIVDGEIRSIYNPGEIRSIYNLLISFDMTSEEFREINLPTSLAHRPGAIYNLSISKLRESLVVLEDMMTVWMMEDGVPKSFTKLFTFDVNTPGDISYVLGFRMTGEAILEIQEYHLGVPKALTFAVYEPYTKHINSLGINGIRDLFFVYSYKETLLLVDQPFLKVYE